MGLALETIVGYNGNLTGSTTFDALTAGSNATFTVRSFVEGSNAYLEDVWAVDDDSIFQLSIKSPRMHDQVKGVLLAGTNLSIAVEQVFVPQPLLPGHVIQRLYSTDVLSVTANGTAADVVSAAFNVRYTLYMFPAAVASLCLVLEAARRSQRHARFFALSSDLLSVAGRDGYLKDVNGSWQAVLGYTTTRTVTAIGITGTDTGNLTIGGPGGPDARETGDFFVTSSLSYQRPGIPVINSNNAGSTTVQIADVLTSGTPNVTWILAQLSQLLPNP